MCVGVRVHGCVYVCVCARARGCVCVCKGKVGLLNWKELQPGWPPFRT